MIDFLFVSQKVHIPLDRTPKNDFLDDQKRYAIFKSSWKKVLPYWLAQISGAYLGAILVQAV